jgi:hypothetical protein
MDGVPACDSLTQGSAFADFVNATNNKITAHNKESGGTDPLLKLKPGWRRFASRAHDGFTMLVDEYPAPLNTVIFSALGNSHSYSYVTTAAPAKIVKQSAEGYGFGVNYAHISGNLALMAGFSYERPFKGSQGQEVCMPIGTSTSTSCNTATVGAPTRIYARIFSLEARAVLLRGFAVAPRLEYDQASSNYGIKLPLYFVPSAKKILTGGLVVGWTKDNRFQGAVVLSKAFSFYN